MPEIEIKPALYLFPVPLADTPPADVLPAANIELLKGVRHFVVENIRSARRFLRAASKDIIIDNLDLRELNEHTRPEDVADLLNPLIEGHPIGIISEAGCPAVADPGADLVAIAQRRGLPVVPLVGPSSILLSLMASGFNGQTFTFRGYLPIDAKARASALRDIEHHARDGHTQIFIETPYRNNKLIDELSRTMPAQLRLCVASDITGPRQSIITRPMRDWTKASYDYSKIPTIFLICN